MRKAILIVAACFTSLNFATPAMAWCKFTSNKKIPVYGKMRADSKTRYVIPQGSEVRVEESLSERREWFTLMGYDSVTYTKTRYYIRSKDISYENSGCFSPVPNSPNTPGK